MHSGPNCATSRPFHAAGAEISLWSRYPRKNPAILKMKKGAGYPIGLKFYEASSRDHHMETLGRPRSMTIVSHHNDAAGYVSRVW